MGQIFRLVTTEWWINLSVTEAASRFIGDFVQLMTLFNTLTSSPKANSFLDQSVVSDLTKSPDDCPFFIQNLISTLVLTFFCLRLYEKNPFAPSFKFRIQIVETCFIVKVNQEKL